MSRPKDSAYLTDAELTWFDLDHYDPLGNSQTPPLSAKEFNKLWTHVIYDRLQLQKHSCSADPEIVEKVKQLFGTLQRTPLAELNFGEEIPRRHPCDTSTVKLLSVNRAHSLSTAFSDIGFHAPEGLQAVDELLLARASPERFFVHLSIDPNARDQKLRNDFAELLANWRKHTNKKVTNATYLTQPYEWHASNFIPFFDLQFFAHLYNRKILRTQYAKKLGLDDSSSDAEKDTFDYLTKRTRQVVSDETFHGLRILGDSFTPTEDPQ